MVKYLIKFGSCFKALKLAGKDIVYQLRTSPNRLLDSDCKNHELSFVRLQNLFKLEIELVRLSITGMR
jgi:hypothetical protein